MGGEVLEEKNGDDGWMRCGGFYNRLSSIVTLSQGASLWVYKRADACFRITSLLGRYVVN